MGLDINGKYSDKTYHSGYGGLHRIRVLSLLAMDLHKDITDKDIETFRSTFPGLYNKSEKNHIIRLILEERIYGNTTYRLNFKNNKGIPPIYSYDKEMKPYWQLLHFSDCEGILVKKFWLKDVDYSKSYHLGCLDKLTEELENLKDWISRTEFEIYPREKKLFFMLYDLVIDENNENGMLTFA